MAQTLPIRRDGARPRFRGAITTLLMLLLAVLIVRDIFVRRWSAAAAVLGRDAPDPLTGRGCAPRRKALKRAPRPSFRIMP